MMNARRCTLVILGLILSACGDDDSSGDNNNGPAPVGRYGYYPESVTYDASENTIMVIGLFGPDEAGLTCSSLPVSEVHHRIYWTGPEGRDDMGVKLVAHLPITREEFEARGQQIAIDQGEGAIWLEFPFGEEWVLRTWAEFAGLMGPSSGPNPAEIFILAPTADGSEIIWHNWLGLGSCGGPSCNDGVCEATETVETCPGDCGCMDSIIQAGEDCDGPDLGGLTCADFGYVEGRLWCTRECAVFTEDCSPIGGM